MLRCRLCGEPMPEHGYSSAGPRSPMELMPDDTLEEYFERAEKAGVIDFHLRIMRSPEGKLDFYIHPQGRDGETGDFTVSAASVSKLNFGAGSSRRCSDHP